MKLNSSLILYTSTLIIGVIMCICSNNLVMMWCGLEISLMSFLPLMISNNFLSSECMMKYFIIQSTSSSLLMMGFIMLMMNVNLNKMIILMSLLLKIGLAPFHNWVLNVIESLTFLTLFLFLTIMKIAPLTVMMYMNQIMLFPSILSLIVGAIMGLNQNSFHKILGYSSIFNMGLLCSCIQEMQIWLTYFIIYSIMLIFVIYVLNKLNIIYINQIMIHQYDLKIKMSLWITLLSLGGMPPMIGFLSKLLVFEYLMLTNHFIILTVTIITSLLVMFYYMRSAYMSLMISSMMLKWNLTLINNLSLTLVFMNLLLLSLLIFLKSFL
uniref:NADH-ubiquinone oxidoreductase chain 2 n=1 Tax=Seasogonia rosea TaxID=3004257 RepID=A0A9E9FZ10_9HEMI|nr:NADH dehydrogenase subunit 2 [Seasogonia rosea]WAP91736.1 NADH dehydrogenase subunit 2 [Seasogonia rosea]